MVRNEIFLTKFSAIFFFLSWLLFISCENLVFPEFSVTDVKYDEEAITLRFSAEPDYGSIASNFTFFEDEKPVSGMFSYSGNCVSYKTSTKIARFHKYKLLLNSNAEDKNGISMSSDFVYEFSLKDSIENPEIKGISAVENMRNMVTAISVAFTKPVQEESFIKSFSIMPSCNFLTEWKPDYSNVQVTFLKPLKENTLYTIKISDELSDIDNNHLLREYTHSFYNNLNDLMPEYSIYAHDADANADVPLLQKEKNNGIDFSKDFHIRFNKLLDSSTFSANIKIKPETSYSLVADHTDNSNLSDSVRLKINGEIKYGAEYVITINDGICDSSGRKIDKGEYHVVNNSKAKQPVKFICGVFKPADQFHLFSIAENYADLLLPCEVYNPDLYIDTPMFLFFDISEKASGLDLVSLMDGLSIKATNTCANISISAITQTGCKELKDADPDLWNFISEKINGIKNPACAACNIKIKSKDRQGLIKIYLDHSICDNLENKMEENLQFTCNKK